jgi:hypothetical protein
MGWIAAYAHRADEAIDRRFRRRKYAMAETLAPTRNTLVGFDFHEQRIHARARRTAGFRQDFALDDHRHGHDDSFDFGYFHCQPFCSFAFELGSVAAPPAGCAALNEARAMR